MPSTAIQPVSRPNRTLATIITIAALCTAAGFGYRYGIRDHIIPRNFSAVEQGQIYRSGRLTPATMEKVIVENKIKTVIDLGAYELNTPDDVLERRTVTALGATRVRFTLSGDATGNPQDYVDALRIMANPANHPLLVHCAAGSERTSAAVMLYRKAFQGVTFEQSLAEAKQHKHDPADNPRLLEYLAKHGDAIIAQVKVEIAS